MGRRGDRSSSVGDCQGGRAGEEAAQRSSGAAEVRARLGAARTQPGRGGRRPGERWGGCDQEGEAGDRPTRGGGLAAVRGEEGKNWLYTILETLTLK